jgi:hypothetical protein
VADFIFLGKGVSMRVMIASKHSLVIELPGRLTTLILLVLAFLHAVLAFPAIRELFFNSHQTLGYLMIALSIGLYLALAYLLLGPLRDKTTITFNGQKYEITIDRKLPGNFKSREILSFKDFDRFEFAAPQNGGFLRLRYADGRLRRLFRVGNMEEFSRIRNIGEITRKAAEEVLK